MKKYGNVHLVLMILITLALGAFNSYLLWLFLPDSHVLRLLLGTWLLAVAFCLLSSRKKS